MSNQKQINTVVKKPLTIISDSTMSCKYCSNFNRIEQSEYGHCVLNPPSVITNIVTVFGREYTYPLIKDSNKPCSHLKLNQ